MNHTPLGKTLLLAFSVISFAGTTRGAGQYLKIDYPASTVSNELQVAVTSELWFDPRRGSEKTFLKALTDFAAKSGHPEIDKVPWALWGHSGGGIWSEVMTTLHPERVVAMWMRSGSALMFLTPTRSSP